MRRRWVVLGAVAVVGAGAAAFVVAWRADVGREVTTEEARRRFEEEASTTSAPAPEPRPAPGVYVYEGSGSESLSFPPRDQQQGPSMPATVTHRDGGCWTFRIDYSTNHWQSWDYCPDDGGLVEEGGSTWFEWDFVVTTVDNTTTFDCDPPATTIPAELEVGDTWGQRCVGTSTAIDGEVVSTGTMTYVGPEDVDVGGLAVAAHHVRQERTMSGAQVGEQTIDAWFRVDDGLPVRNERQLRLDTDTPFGQSTYTESGTFTLTTSAPLP